VTDIPLLAESRRFKIAGMPHRQKLRHDRVLGIRAAWAVVYPPSVTSFTASRLNSSLRCRRLLISRLLSRAVYALIGAPTILGEVQFIRSTCRSQPSWLNGDSSSLVMGFVS